MAAGPPPYENRDRVRDGLLALGQVDAGLPPILERIRPSSRLVLDASGAPNIDLGGGNAFYPDNPGEVARSQVEGYLTAPTRFHRAPGELLDDCIELNRVTRAMQDGLARISLSEESGPFGGFLVVFGVGLGHHLRLLAERLDFRCMIVVEPHDDLLAHSLHVFDWHDLVETLRRGGRGLHVLRGDNLFFQLIRLMRGPDHPFLDGSYFFLHYQSPELVDLADRLKQQFRVLAMSAGWVEDQMTMVVNNAVNFARPGFHLLERRVRSARVRPAFVVGAGPSLDADLEDIRRCRDQVVLISASSALKVLLENGIRPDIHCELENGAGLGDVALDLARRHGGLSDMVLFASPTVNPRIAPCFGRVVYFYRSFVSSTELYAGAAHSTPYAEPTSGNTAVHCALWLGFRDITLFGLDFGARDPDRHHSKDSVYFTFESESELATYTPYDFTMDVPGNFGGLVKTGWLLDWGRTSVANAVRGVPGARVLNCSDGVVIEQTTPMMAEGIELPEPSLPAVEDVGNALADLTRPGADAWRPDALRRLDGVLAEFLAWCRANTAAAVPSGTCGQQAVLPLCRAIIERLHALESDDPVSTAAYRILVGQVQCALATAYYLASRLPGDAVCEGMGALFSALEQSFCRLETTCRIPLPT